MLTLHELMEDPLLQTWDARRVVTALTRAVRRWHGPEVQRWFFFPRQV